MSREMESPNDRAHLVDMLQGYRATCIIVAALKLGLIDEMRAGPANAELLSIRLGTHLPSLRRFLRALEVLGLLQQRQGAFGLTPMGRLLVDADESVRARAMLVGEEYLSVWQDLRYTILTGEPAFEHVFGMSAWEHRKQRPELNASLNRTMIDDQVSSGGAVPAAFDFSDRRLVVDVGGGEGALVAEILAQWPQTTGLVFDQPHVVEGAPRLLSAAGVQDRCQVVGGSFFESVPAGGDAYILQHVLHNWDDLRCQRILSNCRASMAAAAVLLIVENIVPDDAVPSEHLVMLDLHMMTMLGGRERTRGEYRSLLQSAGFEVRRSVTTRSNAGILVATLSV